MSLTIEEKNVLKAHQEGSSDVKQVLENLFPDLFRSRFDRENFCANPFKHPVVQGICFILPSQELLNACREKGMLIPNGLYPGTTLRMLKRLINHLAEASEK